MMLATLKVTIRPKVRLIMPKSSTRGDESPKLCPKLSHSVYLYGAR
jgi:hypothetical protein